MNPRRSLGVAAALSIALLSALFAFQRRDPPAPRGDGSLAPAAAQVPLERDGQPPPLRRDAFDFYLLALTIHPAFCADGNLGKRECRDGGGGPLVIHGLWPENLKSGAYPRDCPAGRLALAPELTRELAAYMPGMASDLHVHEWRKHGGCSGLDDDEYFRRTLALARALDRALHPILTTHAGRRITAAQLRAAADSRQPGLGATFTLHCRSLRGAPPAQRGQAFLIEVRQCIDNDAADGGPGTLLDCATVRRRDQGCGASFNIAGGTP
jgi:ribonuclease I